jgi:hypothetical protein
MLQKKYTNTSNVKMVNNFVAQLFPQLEVKKHSTLCLFTY